MTESHKDYYSTREAAELLGVAVSTIPVWTNNGLLKAWVTGGGHRRISRQSVSNMLKKKKELSVVQSNDHSSILIVEDSAQQTRLYKKHFEIANLNSSVYSAADGYEGLLKIGQILPDVIITDLKMPNMDGFRMIETIYALDELRDSLIIVISGLSDSEIKANGGLPEGVHFYRKPVDFENLTDLIRSRVQATVA